MKGLQSQNQKLGVYIGNASAALCDVWLRNYCEYQAKRDQFEGGEGLRGASYRETV
jgi:hypothetical protein